MGSLDGRAAIITGAGRGIGASVARMFAAEGARLVLNDLGTATDGRGSNASPVRELEAELRATGAEVCSDGGDVGDTATGERLVNLALDRYGQLDVVVNVAGILRDRMIFNLSEEDWDAVARVHLRGHYATIRPAAAYWRSRRNPDGHYRIVNFTSDAALQGSPGQPNYAAAKMGIVGLTYSLANALRRYGVTANAVAPDASTRMTATVPEERRVETDVPQDARSSPDNIAPLVTYLASTQSDWLTGRTLGAGGYDVTLWNDPQVVERVSSDGPWRLADLADKLEASFRPRADGLRPSVFMSQIPGSHGI